MIGLYLGLSLSGTNGAAAVVPDTGAARLPRFTASGSGAVSRDVTGSASLTAFTASGIAVRAVTSTGAADMPSLTATGTGLAEGVSNATGAIDLPAFAASGVGLRQITSSGAGDLPSFTAAGTANGAVPVWEAFGPLNLTITQTYDASQHVISGDPTITYYLHSDDAVFVGNVFESDVADRGLTAGEGINVSTGLYTAGSANVSAGARYFTALNPYGSDEETVTVTITGAAAGIGTMIIGTDFTVAA